MQLGITAKIKWIMCRLYFFIGHPIVRYYLKHPLTFLKNRVNILLLWFKKVVNRDINFDDNISSSTPIDVVIVAVDKDFEVLEYAIDSIRKNVRHPVGNIIIISPKSEVIIYLCKRKKCKFIDEDLVLPITKKDIKYVVSGIDRSGWLFQQLLKWSGDKYVKRDYFLITDADTIFCRPQVFTYHKKIILSVSSLLCYIPYFEAYGNLVGERVEPLLSLTNHHMLFQKSKLARLKRIIEKRSDMEWFRAIINYIETNKEPSVSDYETYGQFVYDHYQNECLLEHWFNLSLSRKQINNLTELVNKFSSDYKTLSFHTYKK